MVVGAAKGEDVSRTMMWTVLGFPLTTVAVPVWLSAGKNLPAILSMKENLHAPLCDAAMVLKDQCIPVKRGSGWKYLNLSAVINLANTGIMQQIEPVEDEIFRVTNNLIATMPAGKVQPEKIAAHYKWLDSFVASSYKELFGIDVK